VNFLLVIEVLLLIIDLKQSEVTCLHAGDVADDVHLAN